jgi:hypothetical protein
MRFLGGGGPAAVTVVSIASRAAQISTTSTTDWFRRTPELPRLVFLDVRLREPVTFWSSLVLSSA